MKEQKWLKAQEFERRYWAREKDNLADDAKLRDYWDHYLRRHDLSLNSWKGKRILEVGCGPEGIIYYCEGKQRVGLDPLAEYYKRILCNRRTTYRDVDLIQGKSENLPFPGSCFDVIFHINVLDHTDSPQLVIKEISRVLKSGGELVFHVELNSPIKSAARYLFNRNHLVGHPHQFTKVEILNLLSSNNFETVSHVDQEFISKMFLNLFKSREAIGYFLLYLPDTLLYFLNKNKFSTSMYVYAMKI